MASMNEKDYYAILGVEKDATAEQIRKAFQQKARELDPVVSKEPDAEDRCKAVAEAYAVLSDDDKRRRYDAMRSGSPFAGTGSYGNPAGTAGTGSYDDFFGWGFPFGGAYTSRRTTTRSRSYNPKAGGDIIYEVTLDDDTARTGVRRGVSYQHYETCSACDGHGSVSRTQAATCPTCGGTGHMTVDLASLFGFGVVEMTCPECEGTGKVVEDPCDVCGGSGRVLTASEVIVDIPAGVHDGQTIRVERKGNAGTNGKPAGDFVCEVLLPSERLTQQQANGLGVAGFGLPFLVMGLVVSDARSLLVWGCILIAFGAFIMLRDGLRSNLQWLKKAVAALAAGAARGVMFALLLAMGGPILYVLGNILISIVPLLLLFMLLTRRMH